VAVCARSARYARYARWRGRALSRRRAAATRAGQSRTSIGGGANIECKPRGARRRGNALLLACYSGYRLFSSAAIGGDGPTPDTLSLLKSVEGQRKWLRVDVIRIQGPLRGLDATNVYPDGHVLDPSWVVEGSARDRLRFDAPLAHPQRARRVRTTRGNPGTPRRETADHSGSQPASHQAGLTQTGKLLSGRRRQS
jgi:hypothetical protein